MGIRPLGRPVWIRDPQVIVSEDYLGNFQIVFEDTQGPRQVKLSRVSLMATERDQRGRVGLLIDALTAAGAGPMMAATITDRDAAVRLVVEVAKRVAEHESRRAGFGVTMDEAMRRMSRMMAAQAPPKDSIQLAAERRQLQRMLNPRMRFGPRWRHARRSLKIIIGQFIADVAAVRRAYRRDTDLQHLREVWTQGREDWTQGKTQNQGPG